jgi:hypothetical protein
MSGNLNSKQDNPAMEKAPEDEPSGAQPNPTTTQ